MVSLFVLGFNGDRATDKLDVWAIGASFTFMEGYAPLYGKYYFDRLK